MPAFNHLLNQNEMRQVSILLRYADQPLDPQVATVFSTSIQPDRGRVASLQQRFHGRFKSGMDKPCLAPSNYI